MKKETVLQMAATIASGILANPAMEVTSLNDWEIQQVIVRCVQSTANAVRSTGLEIDD